MLKHLLVLFIFASTPVFANNFNREPMPDRVYEGLKRGIIAYYAGDADSEALRLNLKGLDEIRDKLPFPKMEELEYLQLTHWRDSALILHCWGKRIDGKNCLIWMGDAIGRRANAEKLSEIRLDDFLEEYRKNRAQLQKYFKSPPSPQSPSVPYRYRKRVDIPLIHSSRDQLLWDMVLPTEPNDFDLLFQYAYVSVWRKETEAAELFTALLLRGSPTFFQNFYERKSKEAFDAGMALLLSGASFRDVYTHWLIVKKVYGQSEKTWVINECLDDIKPQVLAEMGPLANKNTDLSNASMEQKIEGYIDRLQETRPTTPFRSSLTDRTNAILSQCAPLIEIGTPAVSALIERMDDRRFTRFPKQFNTIQPLGRESVSPSSITRIGDVAAACIRKILHFDSILSSFVGSLQSGKESLIKKKQILREFWEKYKNVDPADWRFGQLEMASVPERLGILKEVEARDPQAVDSIALLKKWADEVGEEGEEHKSHIVVDYTRKSDVKIDRGKQTFYLPLNHDFTDIAYALAERGDLSFRPKVQKALRECFDEIKKLDPLFFLSMYSAEPYVSYLTHFGEMDDSKFLYRIEMEEFRKDAKQWNQRVLNAMFRGIQSAKNPRTVLLLIPFLDCHDITYYGVRPLDKARYSLSDIAPMKPVQVIPAKENKDRERTPLVFQSKSASDRALEILVKLVGSDEGFQISDSESDRNQAIERWKQWWENEGKRKYGLIPRLNHSIGIDGPFVVSVGLVSLDRTLRFLVYASRLSEYRIWRNHS